MSRGAGRAPNHWRTAAGVLSLAALGLPTGLARAEVIDLQWQDGGRFGRSLTIAPGEFAELCGPLKPGQAIKWSFKADRALNFNIHYHIDKDVRYPAKRDQVESLQGDLAVDSAQDYCWMWVNKSPQAAQLAVRMTKE